MKASVTTTLKVIFYLVLSTTGGSAYGIEDPAFRVVRVSDSEVMDTEFIRLANSRLESALTLEDARRTLGVLIPAGVATGTITLAYRTSAVRLLFVTFSIYKSKSDRVRYGGDEKPEESTRLIPTISMSGKNSGTHLSHHLYIHMMLMLRRSLDPAPLSNPGKTEVGLKDIIHAVGMWEQLDRTCVRRCSVSFAAYPADPVAPVADTIISSTIYCNPVYIIPKSGRPAKIHRLKIPVRIHQP